MHECDTKFAINLQVMIANVMEFGDISFVQRKNGFLNRQKEKQTISD